MLAGLKKLVFLENGVNLLHVYAEIDPILMK